jgi:hypothetical protein
MGSATAGLSGTCAYHTQLLQGVEESKRNKKSNSYNTMGRAKGCSCRTSGFRVRCAWHVVKLLRGLNLFAAGLHIEAFISLFVARLQNCSIKLTYLLGDCRIEATKSCQLDLMFLYEVRK